MRNKLLSISLIFSVFVSVVSCYDTLYAALFAACAYGYRDSICNAQASSRKHTSDDECDGSCMVESVSDNSDDQNTSRSGNSLLTQYRINLLAVDTNNAAIDPLYHKIYFSPFQTQLKSLWISDPLVPPPQLTPSA